MPRHETKTSFQKGRIPWNKGKKCSEETKEKLIKIHKGKNYSPETEFKKGYKPKHTGKPRSEEFKKKVSEGLKKAYENGLENNGGGKFKGFRRTNFRYSIFRRKLIEEIGKCEICGFDNEFALVAHHKDMDKKNNTRENLILLCANCHYIEHKGNFINKKLKED